MRATTAFLALFVIGATSAPPVPARGSSCDPSLWVRARSADRLERVGRGIALEASIDHNGTGCGGEALDPSLVRYATARSPAGPWAPLVARTISGRVHFVPDAPGLWFVRAESVQPRFSDRTLAFFVQGARGSPEELVDVTLDLDLGDRTTRRAAMELVQVASIAPGVRPVRVWARWTRRGGARARLPRGDWEVRLHLHPGAAPRVARVSIDSPGATRVPMRATTVSLTLGWAPAGEMLAVVLRDARGTVHCDELGAGSAWLSDVAPGPATIVVQRYDDEPAPPCPLAPAQIDFASREYAIVVPEDAPLALQWSAGRVLARAEEPRTSRWIDEAPIASELSTAAEPAAVALLAQVADRVVAIGAGVSELEPTGRWRTHAVPRSFVRGAPVAVARTSTGELAWLEESDALRVLMRTSRGLLQERLPLPYGCRGERFEVTSERIVARGACPAGEPGVEGDGTWRATRETTGWAVAWSVGTPPAAPEPACAALPSAPLPLLRGHVPRRVEASIAACIATARGPVALVHHRISHVDYITTRTTLAHWDGTAWRPLPLATEGTITAIAADPTRIAALVDGRITLAPLDGGF